MVRAAKKEAALMPEEKLTAALVPVEEQPYQVPENWCWIQLGCISTNQYGYTAKAIVDDNLPKMLRITDIQENGVDWKQVPNCEIDESDFKKYTLNDSDIVIARMGATTGKSFLLDNPKNSVFASYLIRLRIKGGISPKYVYSFLQSEEYWRQISDLSSGIALPGVNSSKLQTMKFPLAPIFEQQRIVDRIEDLFAKLDEAKEKAQAVVDGFEDRKAAILHRAFAGNLTKVWRQANDITMDDWASVLLSDVCKINPPKINVKALPDELEVSFFPMPALSEVYGAITDPQVRMLGEVRTGFTNFSEGDVVFAKITPCMENGKSAVIGKLVNDIGFGTTEFFVLRCNEKLYNRFLWHLVRDRYFRDEAKAVMTGAVGQQRVPKSFLESYPLMLPPIQEQLEIVRLLDNAFDKEQRAKEVAEETITQINTMKKAILARAFRGDLSTNDPNDENAVELLKKVLEIATTPVQRKKGVVIPKEMLTKLKTELEKKIVKLYFLKDTNRLPISDLMRTSSKPFDVLETLHNLEKRQIIIETSDKQYELVGKVHAN